MTEKLIYCIILLFIIAGCGTKQQGMNASDKAETVELSIEQFIDSAGLYTDKEIMISGTVTHVCRRGGQRLFITDKETEESIMITTGENIPEFDISLEGNNIIITGFVMEEVIDETYLAQWEAETSKETVTESAADGPGKHEAELEAMKTGAAVETEGSEEQKLAQLESIREKREELAASGKDHLSEYWVEAKSFELKEK
jgi:hypothetical protein